MKPERLQKILAQAGIASRRAAEQLILDGHVRVNGRVVRALGTKADPQHDRVEVDGKRLVAEKPVYYLIHKPRGVVTTLDDPEGRQSISDLVSHIPERVFPVGRLDFQTSGVLLLTNDGAMAQALLHPTRLVPKVYSVKLQGSVDERGLEMLRTGVVLDDGSKTAPATVSIVRQDDKCIVLEITISEGKNRQIHRMAEAIGRRVLRLARISFAGLTVQGLRAGQTRALEPSELNDLKQLYLNPQGKQQRGRGPSSGAHDQAQVAERKSRVRHAIKRAEARVQSKEAKARGRGTADERARDTRRDDTGRKGQRSAARSGQGRRSAR